MVRQKSIPGGTQRNRESLKGVVTWDTVTEDAQVLLCDAQTSGGLLIAVAPERVDRLLAMLRAGRVPAAAAIGEISERGHGEITVTGS